MRGSECKKCGGYLTEYDKGNGEKYEACYGCYEKEEKCTCDSSK